MSRRWPGSKYSKSPTRHPEAGRNMARVLCAISKVGSGPGMTFTRETLHGKMRGMLATRSTLAYFVRKGWVKRAGIRSAKRGGSTGYFAVTRRGVKAAHLACDLLPRVRRSRRRK